MIRPNISEHITYQEATYSETAIRLKLDNTPSMASLERMHLLAENIFEPLREMVRGPIKVTSFYRCPALNKAVGGSPSSQHMSGEAIDIQGLNSVTNADLYHLLSEHFEFDQLIWEFGNVENPAWVHVSYNFGNNRRQRIRIG